MADGGDGVTRRQRQVFQLIADGRHPKQVANDLEIARATVNQHIKLAKKSLGASSTSSALAKLMRRGVVT
jgi:DNA-binding CsgD family transcriptional regulator